MKERNKKKYRHKGTLQTTVKTIYAGVVYNKAVYEVKEEDGFRQFVYLLDESVI